MAKVARSTYDMISGMTPTARLGEFVFATFAEHVPDKTLLSEAISVFREEEGLSLIVPIEVAAIAQLSLDQPMRCITLNVYSSLEGVGLTAAVSSALGACGIPCNMVAAFHHDHVFVPSQLCHQAMKVLATLQNQTVENS